MHTGIYIQHSCSHKHGVLTFGTHTNTLHCTALTRPHLQAAATEAAQIAADAVGAKMVSFCGLRGAYDFMAVFEGSFEQGAGIKMATEASGTLCNLVILEETNLNDIAAHAAKIAQKYKGVGQ